MRTLRVRGGFVDPHVGIDANGWRKLAFAPRNADHYDPVMSPLRLSS